MFVFFFRLFHLHNLDTHLNFIILADWHTAHIVLLSQFLGQRCWHQLPTDVGRGREMPFAVFAPVRCNVLVELHFAIMGGCLCWNESKKSKFELVSIHNKQTQLAWLEKNRQCGCRMTCAMNIAWEKTLYDVRIVCILVWHRIKWG